MGELHDAIVKLNFLVTFRQGFMGPLMNILEVQITLLTETHIRCYLGHRNTGCFKKKSPSSPGNEAELPAAKAQRGEREEAETVVPCQSPSTIFRSASALAEAASQFPA